MAPIISATCSGACVVWATMPSVVPTPSTRIWPAVTCSGVSSRASDQIRMNAPAVAMTTMLLRIGVHIGAAK